MDDKMIIDLYWGRNEAAIEETKNKYGGYLYSIAYGILGNPFDCEEALNDTYLGVWNSIPPARPSVFSSFIARIARNLSLKKYRHRTAGKRGGNIGSVWDELSDIIPSSESVDSALEAKELSVHIDRFLRTLGDTERIIFMRRYWFFDPVADIASKLAISESAVKTRLFRTRNKLMEYLKKEDICL